jgi:hypothetical protein
MQFVLGKSRLRQKPHQRIHRPAVSVSDEPGIQLFAFHGNVNKEMNGLEAGQLARDIVKAKNGRWVFLDDRLKLKVGDVIYYWLYVQYEGLGYQKLDQSWTVTGECTLLNKSIVY